MHVYFLYFFLCFLLGRTSFKKQIKALVMDDYCLVKPWIFEKIVLCAVYEPIKVLLIFLFSLYMGTYNIILVSCLGLITYLLSYTICFKYSASYLVFLFWIAALVFQLEGLQLSLALFLSSYLLSKKWGVASQVACFTFPLCLFATSANFYLVLSSIIMLILKPVMLCFMGQIDVLK